MSPEMVVPVAERTGEPPDDIDDAPPELELEHALNMIATALSAVVDNTIADDRVDRICTSLRERELLPNVFQHQPHSVHFCRLIGLNITCKSKHCVIVTGIAMTEQFAHHADRAEMVIDHSVEKRFVEL